jgi:RNA polymerase sigma factor (sigma-70 family)
MQMLDIGLDEGLGCPLWLSGVDLALAFLFRSHGVSVEESGGSRRGRSRSAGGRSDPEMMLRSAILECGSAELAVLIPPGTGYQFHGYVRQKLSRAGVENLADDADDVYSQFIMKIVRRFRNCGCDDIGGAGWFRTTLKSALTDYFTERAELRLWGLRVDIDTRDSASMEHLLTGQERTNVTDLGSDEGMSRTLVFYLGRLSPQQRKAIAYCRVLGYSTEQLAKELEIKVSSARTLLSDALRRLKRQLLGAIKRGT